MLEATRYDVASRGPTGREGDDEDEEGESGTIPLQPRPSLVRIVHFRLFGWWITAIMRHWSPGDSARCKLCRRCMAYENGCLTVVRGKVEAETAGLLSIASMDLQENY